MPMMKAGVCETLFYTQHSKYNTLYVLQTLLTFLYTLSITLDEVFPWHEDIMKHVRMFLQVISIPVFTFSNPVLYLSWGCCVVFVIATWLAFVSISRGLINGNFESRWLGPVVRVCLGIVGTFWITITRTLYVFVACKDERGILLPEHECSEAGVALLGVSAVIIVLFWALYLVQWMTHEICPHSFNLLARTGCEFDLIHTFWLIAIVTTGLINRPYIHSGMYHLNIPYAPAGCLMVGGLHQYMFLVSNQPFFSSAMNDLKAGFALGLAWNGAMVLAISLLYKLLDNDYTETIRMVLTIVFLVVLPAVIHLGRVRSKHVRSAIVVRKIEQVKPMMQELSDDVMNAAEEDKATNSKLMNPWQADDESVWASVHGMFIAGSGITYAQRKDAVETEIASRFILCHLSDRGHNLKSCRYNMYKTADSDLIMAKTMFVQTLRPGGHRGCQSVYLMLQYIRFAMSYGLMPSVIAAKKLQDIFEMYSEELSFTEWLLQWRVARAAELATRRDVSEGTKDKDRLAIGFEEVTKKQRAAMEFHKSAMNRSLAIWKYLDRSIGNGNAYKTLYKMLEKVYAAEEGATKAYLYVLDKASTNVDTMRQFAVFQMHVKRNMRLANDLRSVADSIGESSMQNSSSQGSGKGAMSTRLEFLNEVRTNVAATATITQLRQSMGSTSFVLVLVVSILFAAYLVLIAQYKQNLINLTESGARRYYSMALALHARDMHAYAIANDIQNFNVHRMALYKMAHEFNKLHVQLIHTYRSTYAEQEDFYNNPNEYISVKIPLSPAGLVFAERAVRETKVNGMDVAFKLIQASLEVQKSPLVDFLGFDKHDPHSFSTLWYVLENSHITAKAMDHSTIIYVYEATDIAKMMKTAFIALSAIAVLIEAVLVLFVFRKNVDWMYSCMYGTSDQGQGALDIVTELSKSQTKEIIHLRLSKSVRKGKPSPDENCAAKNKKPDAKDSGSEEDIAIGQTTADEDADDEDGAASENDHTTDIQQVLLKIFYYACQTIITGCLCTLCALCFMTVSHAEASANDMNNGSRRRYLDGRVLYLTKELLYSASKSKSLIHGTLTWLNSTSLLRCLLRRSGYALLSSHYSLIYGGELGFHKLGSFQNWIGGKIKSWLPEGWSGPVPGQQQLEGYEAPPAWSQTGGDYCTPFTWSHTHFEKGMEMAGSLGNSENQDRIYFTSNCLTDLELTDSVTLTDERIQFFSQKMKPEQCYGFRSGIILCADMDRQASKYVPENPQVNRFVYERNCAVNALVAECEDARNAGSACTAAAKAAWDDCKTAERRRKCDLARRGPYVEKKCLLPLQEGETMQRNDPRCNPMVDFGHGVIAPRDGVERDTELGISDLDFYNREFDTSMSHATLKPRDPIMTMGLHNLVNFYVDNAISIANNPIVDINQDSTYFHRIYKYANGELQSGQEIAGGLFKSILIYQHDALTGLEDNTSVTVIAFVMIIMVVVLQLAFLSQKIETVIMTYFGITAIVQGMLTEIQELSEEIEREPSIAGKEKTSHAVHQDLSAGDDLSASEDGL